MVWGASSGAGKSLLATALCRWAARQGLDVAPYKAQNMSNNARVVPGVDGAPGEIGAAQYFHALAARVAPQVDHNPVLLKPERDTASQVVLQGRVEPELGRMPWRERSGRLAAAARESFDRLAARHALLVIEGAGSPAEINLAPQDYVNLGTARWARAAGELKALLVADIDRGGAFAHLYGTWALLPDDLKPALAGFVLNRFRGDAALLAPGPAQLQALTGVPLLGVLPMWRGHGLPDEDAAEWSAPAVPPADLPASAPRRIAVVAWPRLSNLDEFQPLANLGLLRWARCAADLAGADWIVLPGSKQVSGDLAWLRAQRMDGAIVAHAHAGRPVLGICGGLQVLGNSIDDPDGVDGEAHGPVAGLGLLPLATRHQPPKRLRAGRARFESLDAPWQAISQREAQGYEIRMGHTHAEAGGTGLRVALRDAQGEAVGWQRDAVLGVAVHGLFENADVLRALFGARARTLDDVFDGLADGLEAAVGADALGRLMG